MVAASGVSGTGAAPVAGSLVPSGAMVTPVGSSVSGVSPNDVGALGTGVPHLGQNPAPGGTERPHFVHFGTGRQHCTPRPPPHEYLLALPTTPSVHVVGVSATQAPPPSVHAFEGVNPHSENSHVLAVQLHFPGHFGCA